MTFVWDDSDGWYDHALSGVTNPSLSPADDLTDTTSSGAASGQCGPKPETVPPLGGEQGRCGFGPRLPLLVISPFAGTTTWITTSQTRPRIINLIEYNWHLPGIPGSFDQVLAPTDGRDGIPFDLAGLFDFRGPTNDPLS